MWIFLPLFFSRLFLPHIEVFFVLTLILKKWAVSIAKINAFETAPNLSVNDALSVYKETVAALSPETVLLHIGETDIDFFAKSSTEFDNKYRKLIGYIKSQNKKCRIAIISLRNYDYDSQIEEINKHLKYIADSEQCEYGDISAKMVWNPKTSMDAASFVYSIGFVHPLKNKRPLYDLVKMLFCYEA